MLKDYFDNLSLSNSSVSIYSQRKPYWGSGLETNLVDGTSSEISTGTFPTDNGNTTQEYIDLGVYYSSEVLLGDSYIVTFEAKSTVDKDTILCYFLNKYEPGGVTTTETLATSVLNSQGLQTTSQSNIDIGYSSFKLTTSWTKYWIKYTTKPNFSTTRTKVVVGRLTEGTKYGTGEVSIRNVKVAAGDKVTDWCPSPADLGAIHYSVLERELPGFKVSSVDGRENLAVDIDELEIGYTDGSKYNKKKDATRDITINFALTSDSQNGYNQLVNKLKSLLYTQESKYVFRDESEVYYIGTVSDMTMNKINSAGTNYISGTGTINIHCCNPYKYGTTTKSVKSQDVDGSQEFIIDYEGTKKSFPSIEAKFSADNGYVAYTNDRGNVLQFGNVDEVDGENYEKSEKYVDLSKIYTGASSENNLIDGSANAERVIGTFPSSGSVTGKLYFSSLPLTSTTYVVSFDAKSTVNGDVMRCYFASSKSSEQNCTSVTTSQGWTNTTGTPVTYGEAKITLTTEWTRYWVVYTKPAGDTTVKRITIGSLYAGEGTGKVSIRAAKCEQGSTATAWSPSYNDVNRNNYMHPHYAVGGRIQYANNIMRIKQLSPSANSSKWNCAVMTYNLPADAGGSTEGAQNFYCYMNHWFETGLMGQTGEQSIAFLDANNHLICGYNIFKTDSTGNRANVEFWADGKPIKNIAFTPSYSDYDNPYNQGRGHNDIRKEGGKITFYWWGSYPSYTFPSLANSKCTKIQISFSQYGSRGLGNNYITRNYIRKIDFTKMNVKMWRDDPNKFSKDDYLLIDTSNAQITHKGLNQPDLGVIGNQWEDFYLAPGKNQIKCNYSKWAQTPEFELTYREVFL